MKDKNTELYKKCNIEFDPYGWLKENNSEGFSYKTSLIFPIIYKNRFNKKNSASLNLHRDYIGIVNEDAFLINPSKYIEDAFDKSCNVDSYNITKQITNIGGWF